MLRTALAVIALCLPALAAVPTSAQQSAPDLRAQTQRCATAMLSADVSAALACMHPRLIEKLGGVDGATASLNRQRKAFADQGASFESVSIGMPEPSIVLNEREFALIPQTLRIRVREGVLRQAAHLLAIRDPGAQWAFIDAGAASPKALAILFPETPAAEFEARIKVPPRVPPVLEEGR